VKRLWFALLLPPAAAWLFGRAPPSFVLEEACRAWQAERRSFYLERAERIDSARRDGLEAVAAQAEEEQTRALCAHRRLETRGWEVLFVPRTADRPPADGFLVIGAFDPSERTDPPLLMGPHEIWIRPVGPVARLLAALRLSP